MTEESFTARMKWAKSLIGEYGVGYQRGLLRYHRGDCYSTFEQHEIFMQKPGELGRGYRDGFSGRDPQPLTGRPPLPPDAQRSDKKVRSIRLSDQSWDKLKRLGSDWLENEIAAAPEDDSMR